GADVVKVEPPIGDAFRGFNLNAYVGYEFDFHGNVAFELSNRGKRSITLDLETAAGRDVARRLAGSADVFLTNLLPSRARRYGLTYPDLAAENPRLIGAYVTGYGLHGPERERPGFDYAAFWARSGIQGLIGEEGQRPPAQRGGMGDHSTSLAVLSGILAALYERERSGRGQEIAFSLFNTGLWVLGPDVQAALVSRRAPVRQDPAAPPNPLWTSYRCGDGAWIMLVMLQSDRDWPKVCAAIGRPDLLADARFGSIEGRAQHSREIVATLQATFETASRAEWAARLDAQGLIWAPVQSLAEVVADPQARANGYFTTIDHPERGLYETIDAPMRFGRSRVTARGPAPEPGQQTEEVLLEAGYSWDDIAALREGGAL
ncbi:MAG TPA: CoA transferase, partial [Dehalococcoidia bacterium]|nr:CoA transferase [Dehalococcoidia bacterium]